MPRGLKKIAKIVADGQAKREAFAAGDNDLQRALVLKNAGQTATGRFLEEGDDVVYVYVHDLPKKPGASIADKVLCLDQEDAGVPCYGCQAEGVKRGARLVVNFIRYDEPKLKRDAEGKAVKDQANNYQYETEIDPANGQPRIIVEPALVVFTTGTGAGGRMAYLESQKGSGLTNHVCTIARTADNTNPYMIDVVKENVPPEQFEKDLFAKKIDPMKAITQLGKRSIPAPNYADMAALYGASPASGFAQGVPAGQEGNPYAEAAQGMGNLNLGAFSS